MLKSCEIDFNNPPAKAQEIISAGDVPLGTQGNLFGITGGEGTGNSNYVAAIVAGCICPAGEDIDTPVSYTHLDVYKRQGIFN